MCDGEIKTKEHTPDVAYAFLAYVTVQCDIAAGAGTMEHLLAGFTS